MDWQGRERSENVEDRRGKKTAAVGGGIGVILIALVAYFITGDANKAKQIAGQLGGAGQQQQKDGPPPNDKWKEFSESILGMTEKVWEAEFNKMGKRYVKPRMVIFDVQVATKGCGVAPSAVGPFYCPADQTVYLDPTFFDELEQKLKGSAKDFSNAYVIAHEVGHHVQNLLGYSRIADSARERGKMEGNEASVRLELQADYLAGVWAHHAEKRYRILQQGDIQEALKSANAIGDDRLQKNSQGWVSPESFTHGTSAQREKYFSKGLKSGDASKQTLDEFFRVNYKDL